MTKRSSQRVIPDALTWLQRVKITIAGLQFAIASDLAIAVCALLFTKNLGIGRE